jgi:hypothetical protein
MRRVQWSLPLIFFIIVCLNGVAEAATRAPVSVAQVLEKYQDKVAARLIPRFRFAGVDWPPQELQLLAIKDTRKLELWARSQGDWHYIRDYRIKGMSGRLGPKLKQGDRQVPEGIYHISRLNPNSSYHLSLKVDYPNAYDREMARRDGRRQLGGDIYIHGNQVSAGCLAIGDNAIEEIFVLAALLGKEQLHLLISPVDFRSNPTESLLMNRPTWIGDLHREIASEMQKFQRQTQ